MMNRTLSLVGLVLAIATAAPTKAEAQPQDDKSILSPYALQDKGREGRFFKGSSVGVLPGDTVELVDSDYKPIAGGLTFRIYKVYGGESYGKLEGALTKDRLAAVNQAKRDNAFARFPARPANRSKCEATLPTPIKDSDKAAILSGQIPAGYVAAPIDLKGAIEAGDSFTKVAVGSAKMVLPKAKAYIVTFGAITPTEVGFVEQNASSIKVSGVDLKPGTFAFTFASNARVVIAIGTCS